jgi:hypothetical protein
MPRMAPGPRWGHIEATFHLRIPDNSGHSRAANAPVQQLRSASITGQEATPVLSDTEAVNDGTPIAARSCGRMLCKTSVYGTIPGMCGPGVTAARQPVQSRA